MGPVLLLAPVFLVLPLFILQSRESESRWYPCLPGLCFGREGEGGGRGEGARRREERGSAGAAGPARGEALKKRRQGGKCVVTSSPSPLRTVQVVI
jgi:hypothetical protein